MQFALIGSGGSASVGSIPQGATPPPTATGGGGGVFIGSVVLPTNMQNANGYYGTQLYAFVGQAADQVNSSTFISLKQTQNFPYPQTGEPWAQNGMNGTYESYGGGIPGSGGAANAPSPSILINSTGLVTYPITQIFSGNGSGGLQGAQGTLGGAPAYQPFANWPFIEYPNTPTGQLQSAGNGGSITSGPLFGTGDKGMVIVLFNFAGFQFSLYPPLFPMANPASGPFYFLGTSDGQTADSSITVPNLPHNSDGSVTVTFVLQGSGGDAITFDSYACSVSNPIGHSIPGSTFLGGGSGATFKGSVSLMPGTVIYIHVSANGGGNGSSTYLTLIPPPGGAGTAFPAAVSGINGQTQASPWVGGGTDPDHATYDPVGGSPGSGGTYESWPLLYDSVGNYYPITTSIAATTGKNATGWACGDGPLAITPPVLVPASGLQGYLQNIVELSPIPSNGYGGGYLDPLNDLSGSGGMVIIGFDIDIPLISSVGIGENQIPCFPEGTRILTPLGYKFVETIQDGYLVITAANRQVPVKVFKRTVHAADSSTAPYLIPKYSLSSFPTSDLRLSPLHAFRLQPDLWQIPKYAAKQNKQIKQYGIGMPVTYYHLECPNYFQDNLLVDGSIVESYGKNQVDSTVPTYTFIPGRKGFVRTAKPKNILHHRFTQ